MAKLSEKPKTLTLAQGLVQLGVAPESQLLKQSKKNMRSGTILGQMTLFRFLKTRYGYDAKSRENACQMGCRVSDAAQSQGIETGVKMGRNIPLKTYPIDFLINYFKQNPPNGGVQ